MEHSEKKLLRQPAATVCELCADMLELEASLVDRSLPLHKNHLRSARNLAHYIALRRHDLRDLQGDLASLGLSSLGRSESHVLSAIQAVHHILSALLGQDDELCSLTTPVKLGEGSRLLNRNTAALLGRKPLGRKVRIMVTMPTEASTDL
jgi:pyruvate kinase